MAFKRAIVTAVGPLRILIDGDTVAVPFTPKSLIDPATLTVGDVVHANQSGHRLVVLGRVGGLGLLSGRNLIINSNFMVNQRGAVSGTSFATGGYFLDRWLNPTGGSTTTWADSGGVRTLTLGDGTGFRYASQIVEASTLPAGTYTVSWEGTAELYIFVLNTVYADSPVTFTTDGTAAVNFRFRGNGDTLRNVKLERGSVPTPYQTASYDDELRACMRYYQKVGAEGANYAPLSTAGHQNSSTEAYIPVQFATPMREVPTCSSGGAISWFGFGVSAACTVSFGEKSRTHVRLDASFSSSGSGGATGFLRSSDGTGWLAFDAEL